MSGATPATPATPTAPVNAAELPGQPPPRSCGWWVLVRYGAGLAVFALVMAVLVGKRGQLTGALRRLGGVDPHWVAAAVLAEAAMVLMFTLLQQRALAATGVRPRLGLLYLLSMANLGIANTVPGEPVVSGAYRYRQYRAWGASGSGAAWTLFIVLMSQSVGMAGLLLAGVLIALASGTAGVGTGAAIGALVVIVGAGAVLVRRDLLLRLATGAVKLARRATRRRPVPDPGRIEGALARMREIPLGPRDTVRVAVLGGAMWAADFLCLIASMRAVHVAVPWHGVLLAYGAAQVVGSLPIVPGGLGIIEGSLAVVLVAYGMGHVGAVSAVLMWRLVTYWMVIATGWCAVAALERIGTVRRGDRARRLSRNS
jgi:uncharacterized protein (TIRG00374 family)